jgi:hypothetical protein
MSDEQKSRAIKPQSAQVLDERRQNLLCRPARPAAAAELGGRSGLRAQQLGG